MTSRELPKILPTEVREHLARAREALNETDPAGGPVTEHTEPRLTAQDLREAVGLVLWYKAGRLHPDPDALAARLEAHADRLDALWAVLDALSEADLRTAVRFMRTRSRERHPKLAAAADRLTDAADALRALEAEHGD